MSIRNGRNAATTWLAAVAIAWAAPAAAAEDACGVLARHLVAGTLGTLQQAALAHPHDAPEPDKIRALIGDAAFERHVFQDYAAERVQVDLDGDGRRDNVLLQVVGDAHCPRVTAFAADKRFLGAAGSELWCGWSPLFMTVGGAAHLVADDHGGGFVVARLTPGEGFRRLCDVRLGWSGRPELDDGGCSGGLCAAVAQAAPALLARPQEIVGGREGSADFIRDGRTFRSDSGLFVDLDGDGRAEYLRTGRGNQDQLYVEILAADGGAYRDVDAAQRWPGFEALSPSGIWTGFFAEEKLDFVTANGRTALVAVAKDRADGAFAAHHAYRLGVFAIEEGRLVKHGDIVTADHPTVAVERCERDCALPSP